MRIVKTVLLIVLLAVFSGCAGRYNGIVSFQNEPAVDKTLVREFNRYWDFRANINTSGMNIAHTFSMEAPFMRDMLGEKKHEAYVKMFHKNAEMKDVKVLSVNVVKDFYVTFEFEASFLKKNEIEKRIINDDWIMINGKWYHLLKNRLLFPFFEL